MKVHIFTAPNQDATSYDVEFMDGRSTTFYNNPRRLIRCFSCNELRWVKNMVAQVFYDGTRFYCKGGCNIDQTVYPKEIGKTKRNWCSKHQVVHKNGGYASCCYPNK